MATRSEQRSDDLNAELKKEIETLRADMAAIAETLKEMAHQQQSGAKAQIDATVERVTKQGEKLASAASDQFTSATREVESAVARNPIQSILIALGIGFAIGLLRGR